MGCWAVVFGCCADGLLGCSMADGLFCHSVGMMGCWAVGLGCLADGWFGCSVGLLG